jgi:thermitase
VPQSQVNFADESQFNFADRPQLSFVDQSQVYFVDQSQTIFVDQSQVNFVDLIKQLPAFGHGTMMAGLVHLVAPKAGIIPLKAFDATGAGTDWNVVQAIYDAVDLGADVINMSFSSTKRSRILESAIQFAARSGVVVVSAGGNDNSEERTYPASLPNVIGVSALDYNDQKAAFSNYGSWVDLSAIGVGLLTTYPGGHWAMGSGTSDAVPLVSGVLALIKHRGTNGSSARQKIEDSADPLSVPYQYRDKLGKGRLDAFKAVTDH